MPRIMLDEKDRSRLEELQPNIDELERAVQDLEDAGLSMPGIKDELAKAKRSRDILLERF